MMSCQVKLNVCFLLKHNIGDSIVHLAYRQEEESEQAEEEEEEEPGEDWCHPSGYNRRRSRAAVS